MRRTAVLLLGLALSACDDDPETSIDVHAVALDAGDVLVTVINDGDVTGDLRGCFDAPLTFVSRWNGSEWDQVDVRNWDCDAADVRSWTLAPGDDVNWAVNVEPGRYRFSVDLIVDGDIGAARGTSNAVDM